MNGPIAIKPTREAARRGQYAQSFLGRQAEALSA